MKNISADQMQKIAKEMNYSETTFILSDEQRDRGYDVRIFTPETEVPFAGHPTLGTAYLIRQEIIKEPVETINLNLKAGQIPVSFNYKNKQVENLWMKQIEPVFTNTIDRKPIAEILHLGGEEIDDGFPVQEVSTGIPFVIVPLKTLAAVKKAGMIPDKYPEIIKAVLIFCPETYRKNNDLNVRVFAHHYGVPEDPATGSANGCLAGYLVKNNYFGKSKIDIRVEQGYEMGRPSLLYLRAEDIDGRINVLVGGKVVMVAKGELI